MNISKNKILFFITTVIFSVNQAMAIDSVSDLSQQMKASMKQSMDLPGVPQIILSTLFMIFIVYLVAFVYKKINMFNQLSFSSGVKKVSSSNKLNIINSKSLGGHNALHIVEINNKYLIIGSTPSNVTLLKEFDKESIKESEEVKSVETVETVHKPEVTEKKTINSQTEIPVNTDFEEVYRKYL